jgi:hypothetical protein
VVVLVVVLTPIQHLVVLVVVVVGVLDSRLVLLEQPMRVSLAVRATVLVVAVVVQAQLVLVG